MLSGNILIYSVPEILLLATETRSMNEIYKYFYCILFYLWSSYILMVNVMVQIYIIKIHVLFFAPQGRRLC